MKKYYILKTLDCFFQYKREFPTDKQLSIDKRFSKHGKTDYMLIEKTIIPTEEKGPIEEYTNMWPIMGLEECYKIIGSRIMYDYTGIVHPLIHKNKQVLTWEQYKID